MSLAYVRGFVNWSFFPRKNRKAEMNLGSAGLAARATSGDGAIVSAWLLPWGVLGAWAGGTDYGDFFTADLRALAGILVIQGGQADTLVSSGFLGDVQSAVNHLDHFINAAAVRARERPG